MLEAAERLILRERFQLRTHEADVDGANRFGASAKLLENLGHAQDQIDLSKPNYRMLWTGLGIMIVSGMTYVAGTTISDDVKVDPFYIEVINSQLEFLRVHLSDKANDFVKGAATIFGSSALFFVVLRTVGAVAENSIHNVETKSRIRGKIASLNEAVRNGEARLDVGPGHLVINLGQNGDSIGSEIGERTGWGKKSIPIVEADRNFSGSPLWVKAPRIDEVYSKEKTFEAFDRARLDTASAYIICPQNHEQAFLPDPTNKDHYDLSPDEVLRSIYDVDAYCRDKRIPVKKIVIIGDKRIKSAVGPIYGNGDREISGEFTLEQLIEQLSKTREEEVIIVDPTEVALNALNNPRFNPKGLPLGLYGNPNSSSHYGQRFAEQSEAMGIDVIKNPGDTRDALMVVHGSTDIETMHLARLIDGNLMTRHGTVSVITDGSRGNGDSDDLVLSDLVSEEVLKVLGMEGDY